MVVAENMQCDVKFMHHSSNELPGVIMIFNSVEDQKSQIIVSQTFHMIFYFSFQPTFY